jgi:hypothetical protein
MSADALDNALAAFRGVTDPAERGRIIERAERLVAEMKEAGPWELTEF